jgi:Asp-tRNA(Asn)/Glu-tRNA(Gln) amidotransferase A subunit family amidase
VEFIQANRIRTQLIADMDKLFQGIDVLVAPPFGGELLLYSNFTGHPTLALPDGDRTGGAETTLSFTGRLFGEAEVLQLAQAYQAATAWHRMRPDLSHLPSP